MSTNAKVTLTPKQETLLITLHAKAQPDDTLFNDPAAQEILNQIDYDFSSLRVPNKTVVLVCQRAKKIDAVTREFLAENPGGVVLQLGCGLDSRFWRVDNGRTSWYDLDMPEVIALRRQLVPENDRCHLIASSVTDLAWVDSISANGQPVLVVAEGLLMYLDEENVRRLILKLHETFPGCRLIADVFSKMAAKRAGSHPSLKSTGAAIGWGLDDPTELESWAPGIRLLEEWHFSDDPDLPQLSFGYRLAYKLSGKIKLIRRAHRILTCQLGTAPQTPL